MRQAQLMALAVAAVGCSLASADPPSSVSETRDPSPVPSGRQARVRYDLVAHLERAELRDGSTRHIELGDLAGAQVTGGGWLSNVGEDRAVDGESAAVTIRPRARLSVSAPGHDFDLSVRLTAFRPGTVRLYWDQEEIASAEVRPGWTVVTSPVQGERAEAGEHELLLRMDRGQNQPGGGRAYLALDWIRMGSPDAPSSASRPRVEALEGAPSLQIPDGWSVGYPMEALDGARLRGRLEGPGELEVAVTGRGRASERLRVIPGGRQFDIDLSAYAGDVARVDLIAHRGPVVLRRAAVVTLDGAPPTALRRPRNVVLYLIDTLRADRLTPYAPTTRVRTPSVDRFASTGGTFVDARSQESWTKPSVATLLSSLMPWEHTAFSDASVVPPTVDLLPELLQARGFETAGFVANGYVSDRFGFRRGFGTWRNYIREGRRTRGELVAQDVLGWLDGRSEDTPFFLYVHAIDPHVPYRPPAEFVSMYDPLPYRGPVDFTRSATILERIKTGALQLSERDRTRLVALYDGEVSYQDAQLGRILEGLESRGLDDDTMVVITADHGEELFDHGSVGHGHSLFDELVHVPLFVRVPGLPARRIGGSVGLVDVAPTILDALGEPVPGDISGRSLLPLLRGEGTDAPSASVAGFMEHRRSITVGRYKLISRSGGRHRLYDLREDPDETRDLSSERPMVLRYLRGLLGIRLAETRARPIATRAQRSAHHASEAVIDPELNAQLEALGYVGTSRR